MKKRKEPHLRTINEQERKPLEVMMMEVINACGDIPDDQKIALLQLEFEYLYVQNFGLLPDTYYNQTIH